MNMEINYVMGVHCIDELLTHAPQRIRKIFIVKQSPSLLSKLQSFNIPVVIKDKNFLYHLVGSESHQNIVAEVTPHPKYDFKEYIRQLEEKKTSCLLLLDNITDPHNLGAIFRCAECFKVDALIWSKNRGAKITPTVSKVSSGASELLASIRVANLAQSLAYLQQIGYTTIATHVDPSATNVFQYAFDDKIAIVLGSEGKGVQPLIVKNCDAKVYIPMQGKIASLNVSQAASVILAAYNMHLHIAG